MEGTGAASLPFFRALSSQEDFVGLHLFWSKVLVGRIGGLESFFSPDPDVLRPALLERLASGPVTSSDPGEDSLDSMVRLSSL